MHQLADEPGSTGLSVGLLVIGLVAALAGGARFAAADRAVRSGRVPVTGRSPYALVGLVAAIAVAAALFVLA